MMVRSRQGCIEAVAGFSYAFCALENDGRQRERADIDSSRSDEQQNNEDLDQLFENDDAISQPWNSDPITDLSTNCSAAFRQ